MLVAEVTVSCDHLIGTTEESWDGCFVVKASERFEIYTFKGGEEGFDWFNFCPLCGEDLRDE